MQTAHVIFHPAPLKRLIKIINPPALTLAWIKRFNRYHFDIAQRTLPDKFACFLQDNEMITRLGGAGRQPVKITRSRERFAGGTKICIGKGSTAKEIVLM